MPGGVSSPVRAFKAVGGDPLVIAHGSGPHIFDVDGRRYIDYVGAYGPLILGHAPPRIADVVAGAAKRGTAYGATSELEIELARLICEAVPSMELVRFVNSGTEATMSALRLALSTQLQTLHRPLNSDGHNNVCLVGGSQIRGNRIP